MLDLVLQRVLQYPPPDDITSYKRYHQCTLTRTLFQHTQLPFTTFYIIEIKAFPVPVLYGRTILYFYLQPANKNTFCLRQKVFTA